MERATSNNGQDQRLSPSRQRFAGWPSYLDPKSRLQKLLSKADIQVDGSRRWDPIVKDQRFYRRVLRSGSIGLGDSYMDCWWDCNDLDGFFCRILQSGLANRSASVWKRLRQHSTNLVINLQTRSRSTKVAKQHYDLGNALYQCMLDHRLVYSCARWRHASTLDEAQEEKLHTVCEILALQPGMRLLDIGCGWGSLAKFAAEKYGVSVVGITISREQCDLARHSCAGLPVEILLQDYRDLSGRFDRIASLGMFEHVGRKNYKLFFKVAHQALKPNGLLYLGTIGSPEPGLHDDPWILKHIFPNSHIPSWEQITNATAELFSVENRENWGKDYGMTVTAWLANVQRNWDQLRTQYDERFERMWTYYLSASAATFHVGHTECWQILLSPK